MRAANATSQANATASPAVTHIALVGDSHMRNMFVSIAERVGRDNLQFRMRAEKDVWREAKEVLKTMHLQQFKDTSEVRHVSAPFRVTWYTDWTLDGFPGLIRRWEANEELRPSLVITGGGLHWMKNHPPPTGDPFRNFLATLAPHLVRLAASVPVYFKLIDYVPRGGQRNPAARARLRHQLGTHRTADRRPREVTFLCAARSRSMACDGTLFNCFMLEVGVFKDCYAAVGTYKTRGKSLIYSVIKAALQAGYRAFDTAAVYRNETEIGDSLKQLLPEFGLERKDIFITSKLSPQDHGFEKSLQAFEWSLSNLQLTYLDLYLIHWPGVQKLKSEDAQNQYLRGQSWKALESIYKSGKVRAIGVSNYTVGHLEDLLKTATIVPHVNQVEYHPHYLQKDLKKFCDLKSIHLQAYSSLGTTVEVSPLLQDSKVLCIASRLSRSPAQVLLRWATQQGVSVLPKSTNTSHITENIQLDFDLTAEDIAELSGLGISQKYAWDPSAIH
ncbi:glyoxal reductase isoform X4 [Penaeus vannamei]|uniref:glyoxal reductase isoform X4 n=1 Tax=Penaeus vannamei TaxID=6689 RepID=UPI00387F985A